MRWRCQKQPCTNITLSFEEKTISGCPGRFLLCNRYRYPIPCASRRTAISGFVSVDRMRPMRTLRSNLVRVSMLLRFVLCFFSLHVWNCSWFHLDSVNSCSDGFHVFASLSARLSQNLILSFGSIRSPQYSSIRSEGSRSAASIIWDSMFFSARCK